MTPKEKAREDFKRALIQTTRALSSQNEVEVAFGGDHAQVSGKRARIPLPARVLDPAAAAIARGEADAAALRLAHHDDAKHAQLAPKGPQAQAVFTALENARCEAIGAQGMKGVGDNLAAALDKTLADKGYNSLDAANAAPLADVAALLLRERLTGRPSPTAASRILESSLHLAGILMGAERDGAKDVGRARPIPRILLAEEPLESCEPFFTTLSCEFGVEITERSAHLAERITEHCFHGQLPFVVTTSPQWQSF